jgi:hypothetical protein
MNSALRQLTNNTNAKIEMSLVPFDQEFQIKDDFEDVLKGIYSYIALVVYTLPMYTLILRL